MALNLFFPTQYGQGINLQLGDTNGDGKMDVGLGVRGYQAYGNGYGGVYNAGEVGFNTGRGAYVDGMNGSWNGMQRQDNYWGSDTSGVNRGSSTYQDVFGNSSNNRYANDVWGNYSQGSTNANLWGYSNSNVGGNVWTGQQNWNQQQGNMWGQSSSWGGTPGYGSYAYSGGYSTGGWFGY